MIVLEFLDLRGLTKDSAVEIIGDRSLFQRWLFVSRLVTISGFLEKSGLFPASCQGAIALISEDSFLL